MGKERINRLSLVQVIPEICFCFCPFLIDLYYASFATTNIRKLIN